jgi:vacuolar protein sorting-associated protein 45
MDVVKAVQGYITKIVNGTSGIKVLLLDSHTVPPLFIPTYFQTPIISVATTQSTLLNHEVYLIE